MTDKLNSWYVFLILGMFWKHRVGSPRPGAQSALSTVLPSPPN